MVTRPKFLDDLAGMAGGAFSALSGLGEEIEQLVRTRIDEALARLKVVRREEFDAVAELAANARAGEEDAAARIAALEARIAALEAAPGAPGAGATRAGGVGASRPGTADPHLDSEGGIGGPPASIAAQAPPPMAAQTPPPMAAHTPREPDPGIDEAQAHPS